VWLRAVGMMYGHSPFMKCRVRSRGVALCGVPRSSYLRACHVLES